MSTKKFGIVTGIALMLSVVVSPAFAACSLTTLSECDNNGLMALVLQLLSGQQTQQQTTGTITGIPAGFTFTTNLKQGSTGNDVKYLQVLLNSDTATSVGNKGSETSYFGAMTKAAVVKFQNKYASETLTPYGLTAGTGFFGSTSRAKANAMIAAGVGTGTGTGTGTPVTGGFSVKLATDNPAAGTLVTGQATGDLAHYTFSNGTSSAVVVTGVELTRIGVSADATLANVYLFNGAVRLTDAGTVSSGKVNFNAVNGLFTIPANSTVTVTVKSDIAALNTAGQTIGVSLSGVTSNGTLSNTTLPIAGNIFNIAAANLAIVAIANVLPGGTTTDPTNGVLVWQADLQIGVNNVNFSKLALRQINSITSADISNFKLQIDGVEAATVAGLDSNNMVTFTFNKALNTGTRNVKVFADVTGGSSRFISMSLRSRADIDVKDAQYGVNVSAAPVPATAGPITVNPGTITATINNNVLPITVANSASNVLIGKYTLKAAGESIRVDNLYVGMTLGTDIVGATLRNAKVMINGAQAGSTSNLQRTALGWAAITPFAINYTFQPGVATTVEIYADIFNNGAGVVLAAGNTISTNLLVPGAAAANGTRQVSLSLFSVPTTQQNGAAVAIGASSATLTVTSDYTAQTTVVPRNTFKIGSWAMKAGTAEDINVNGLSFAITALAGGDFTVADLANMYVVYKVGSGAAVTTSITTAPADPQAFAVSFTLPRTQTATIELYADITGTIPTTVTAGTSLRTTLTVTGNGAQSGVGSNIPASLGQIITAQNGNITVTRDASTQNATLAAQNNNISSVAYKFAASNDSFDVTQLTFSINDPSAVAQVNLMDGTTVLASASPAPIVVFNGFASPITISANQSKILTLQLVLGQIGTGAGNTGANVTSNFIGGPASTASLLRPASTGIATGPAYTSAPGNAIFVYQAVPTISLISLPSGVLQAGTNTIAKFSIGTTGGTINWKELQFTVAKSGLATGVELNEGNVELWDADSNTQIQTTSIDITGGAGANDFLATDTGGQITIVTANEQQVSGAKNYELRATFTVVGAITVGDYFQTRILSPSIAFSQPNTYAKAVATKFAAANGWAYTAAGPVAAGHTRVQVADNFVAASVVAGSVNNYTSTAETKGYGLSTGDTIILNGSATGGDLPTVTGTLVNKGYTCTPSLTNTQTKDMIVAGGATLNVACVRAGGSITLTYTFGAQVGGTWTAGSTITSTITNDAGTLGIGAGAVDAADSDVGLVLSATMTPSFVWSDNSAALHSDLTADWTTDYLVKNLPTNTQNLVK